MAITAAEKVPEFTALAQVFAAAFRLDPASAAFAPAALKNSGLRAILEDRSLTLLNYDSLADLEKETLRLRLAAQG